MLNAKAFDRGCGVSSRRKSSSEDIEQFLIESTDTHILNVEIWPEDVLLIALTRGESYQGIRWHLELNLSFG